MTAKPASQYLARPALESDMAWIEERIRRAGLDAEEMLFHEFWVVETGKEAIAFGRLKDYADFLEIADVFVEKAHRNHGVGAFLVRNLLRLEPDRPIYVTTPIPAYFQHFGFKSTEEAPPALQQKIERHFAPRGQTATVMQLERPQTP